MAEQNTNHLADLAQQILDTAEGLGASAAEVSIGEDAGFAVSVRDGDIETVEFNKDKGFGISVYFGAKKGNASTSDASRDSIEETVKAACNIARFTQVDDCNGLADAQLLASEEIPLDLDHPWALEVDEAKEMALTCEAAALSEDKRVKQCDSAQVSSSRSTKVYANSNGFSGTVVATRHGMSAQVIASVGEGMQRDYWYTVNRRSTLLEAAGLVGQKAAARAVARLGASKVKSTKCPILFSPEMASGLISHLLGAISGSALYRKASFLLDSLGTQVADEQLTLTEEPHLPGGLGSAWFDAEGVATKRKNIIENGVVATYLLGSYSARKLKLATTANAGGIHNLRVAGKKKSFDALLNEMGTGLLVTELMGQGVSPVTGDYSRGAAGFWVENGQISHAVEEVTIASNLKDMFRGLVAIGDDVDTRGNIQVGSMLIDEMSLAS